MGLFDKLKAGLTKTKESLMGNINSLFTGSKIDDDFYDELEEILILSDIGARTSEDIVTKLKAKAKAEKLSDTEQVRQALKEIIAEMLGEDSEIDLGLIEAVEKNLMKLMEIVTDFLEWHFEKVCSLGCYNP